MIYALVMIVILNNNDLHFPEKIYHPTLQECGEAARVIMQEHYKDGADKVYLGCFEYMEG